jgi:hypothetical protein
MSFDSDTQITSNVAMPLANWREELDGATQNILYQSDTVITSIVASSLNPTPIARDSIKVVKSIDLEHAFSSLPHHDSFLELLSPLLEPAANAINGSTKLIYQYERIKEDESRKYQGQEHEIRIQDQGIIIPADVQIQAADKNINNPPHSQLYFYRSDQWYDGYLGLVRFQKKYGHCRVPRIWSDDRLLAEWVKRQRYQYRLKQAGMRCTLTDRRESMLGQLAFVWDSHESAWARRLDELTEFIEMYGHCLIPSRLEKYRQLATWVRCQRRLYRRYCNGDSSGDSSCMTRERISKLSSIPGFDWKL